MVERKDKLLKCVAVAIVLSFVLTSLAPVANGAGWGRFGLLKTGLLLTQIGAGDVDRDGAEELYVSSLKGKVLKVLKVGNEWSKLDVADTPDSVTEMLVCDLNGDGYDEIYVAAQHSTENGRIYRITYNGASWNTAVIYNSFAPSDYPMTLAMGDANYDGIKDLYWIEAGGAIKSMHQSQTGWTVTTIDTNAPGHFRSLAVGDGDGNGYTELYVGTDETTLLRYSFTGAVWQSGLIGNCGFDSYWDYVRDIVIGDPDHDGITDVIVVAGERYLMSFEYSPFQGIWTSQIVESTTEVAYTYKLAIGDTDADGKDDLIGTSSNNTVYAYPWYSDLVTWGRSDVSMGPLPKEALDLVIAEIDGEPDYKEIYVPCEDGVVYKFSRDVDPPLAPLVWSPTHPEDVWINKSKVKMEWTMTTADQSGIAGYSYAWTEGAHPYPPDQQIDLQAGYTSLEDEFPDTEELYFGIRAMDGAGNWGFTAWYGPILIDVTLPAYAHIQIEEDAKFIGTNIATLTIDANDTFSGLSNMSFSNDGKHWSDWVPYQSALSGWDLNLYSPGGITDGPRTVTVRVQDRAGNVLVGDTGSITLDQTPPRGLGITIGDGQRYIKYTDVDLKLTWEPSQDGAQITAMSFSNDNNLWSPWENMTITKAKWSLINDPGGWDKDGEHKVYFRIIDEAGNIGGPTFAPVVLDRTPPSGLNILVNNGDIVTKNISVLLALKADDKPEHSGLGYMSFKEEGGEWTDWTVWSAKATMKLSSTEGTKLIYYKAKDKAGNEAEPVRGFVVLDTATPKISHVRVLGISDKGAVIYWLTDIPANGLVRYGATVNYNSVQSHTDLVTVHSVTLSGLRPSSEYHFRVESTDQPVVTPTMSRDYIFATKATTDNIPPAIMDLRVEGLTSSTAVVSWKTNEPSDTRLRYGLTTQYELVEGDSKDRLDHLVILRGLEAGKTYYFVAQSSDSRGNGPTESLGSFVTTTVPDTTAPTISNLDVSGITDTLAIVTWYTNEPALGIIEYGTSNGYGSIAVSERYEKVHRVVLMGLKPDTMYYLVVRAIDVVGNGLTTSEDKGFFTMKFADRTPPIITNVRVEAIEATSAIISWATDEPSDSAVDYRSETGGGETVYDLGMVETHSLALGSLVPNTEYFFTVQSIDASGNGPSISTELFFKTGTETDTEAPNIYNVSVTGVSNQVAVVLWDTDKQAKCEIGYGLATKTYTFQVREEGYFMEHSTVLWNLLPDSTYYIQVKCTDPAGRGPATSDEVSFRTSTLPDKDQPELLDLKVWNITTNSVIIEWRTEEPADTEIRFGKGDQLDMVARDNRYVFKHVLALQNLMPNTTYKFMAYSTDPSGNEGSGQKLDFTTKSIYIPPPPPHKPPPNDGNDTTIADALPWVALVIILMLVLGLTGFMYRQGLLKLAPASTDVTATTSRPMSVASASSPSTSPIIPVATDEGVCPHCKGHISLSAAATELSRERSAEEERRQQKAEAERARQSSIEAQRNRYEERQKRLRSQVIEEVRAPPSPYGAETNFATVEPDRERADKGEPVADDELAELYQEVEQEKTHQSRPSASAHATHSHGHHHHKQGARHAAAKPISTISQSAKRAPLKTVKCGHCEGRVPVYTEERPVRITCPSCGKSGTLRGH